MKLIMENWKSYLEGTIHVVKKGENLTRIAKKYKTTIGNLLSLNKDIKNRDRIYIDQKIVVPASLPGSPVSKAGDDADIEITIDEIGQHDALAKLSRYVNELILRNYPGKIQTATEEYHKWDMVLSAANATDNPESKQLKTLLEYREEEYASLIKTALHLLGKDVIQSVIDKRFPLTRSDLDHLGLETFSDIRGLAMGIAFVVIGSLINPNPDSHGTITGSRAWIPAIMGRQAPKYEEYGIEQTYIDEDVYKKNANSFNKVKKYLDSPAKDNKSFRKAAQMANPDAGMPNIKPGMTVLHALVHMLP